MDWKIFHCIILFVGLPFFDKVDCSLIALCSDKGKATEVCQEMGLHPQCDSKIYCQGDLLCTIQMARIFNDSKTFVDMKQKSSEKVILANFEVWKQLNPNPTPDAVKQFVMVSENSIYFHCLLD